MQNPPSDETGQAVDLTNCDREPIHVPGSVQPHGVLLALRPENLVVLQMSENVERLFGVGAAELLNQSVENLLGVAQTGHLRDSLGRPDLGAANPLALSVTVAGVDRAFHGVIHRSGETIVPVPSSGADDLGEALSEESHGLLGKEGVLQYARVGRVSIKPEPVDVGFLLTDIIDPLAPAPGMIVEVGTGMPTLVTENLRLQQVSQNLISNALKHNTKPNGHI